MMRKGGAIAVGNRRFRRPPRIVRAATAVGPYVPLTIIGLILLFPILWMALSSFKTIENVAVFPPQWIPRPFAWRNYVQLFERPGWPLYLRNSLIIAGLSTVGSVLSSSIVAFGFARLRFKGRDFWFAIVLSTMVLPEIITLIPRFLLFKSIGWYDTWLPLIVPHWFGSAFNIFLLRQFFLTLPAELDEAARLDGANALQIYWRIIMPLSKAALAVVIVLSFITSWNDFLGPLVFLQSQNLWPMALGIRTFVGENVTQWHLIMAAATVMILPVSLLFFLVQRAFQSGVVTTGLGGR
jgi:multiple sugar transport system permease protein